MVDGEQATDTDVMVMGTDTVTVADPDLVESSEEVAVMLAVPAPAGVKTPALLMAPMLEGLTDQVTPELKLPDPVTVAVHVEVWDVRIEFEEQLAATDEIVAGGVIAPPPPQPVPAARIADASTSVIRLHSM